MGFKLSEIESLSIADIECDINHLSDLENDYMLCTLTAGAIMLPLFQEILK